MTVEPRRLMARFILRKSAGENYHRGRMPMAAGDYITETRVIGDDVEILMFLKSEDMQP